VKKEVKDWLFLRAPAKWINLSQWKTRQEIRGGKKKGGQKSDLERRELNGFVKKGQMRESRERKIFAPRKTQDIIEGVRREDGGNAQIITGSETKDAGELVKRN